MELTAFLFGLAFGIALTGIAVAYMIKSKGEQTSFAQNLRDGKYTPALVAVFAALLVFGRVGVTFAQTPVPLEIPTDVIFTETNTWIETFAPIAAIGIGITVALAVLGYLGKMIAGAFKH